MILQHLLFMSAIYLIYMLRQKEFRVLHTHLETGSKIFIIMDIDFIIWILFGQAKNKLCVFATICVCTSLSMYLRGQSFDMFHVLPAQVPYFLATWHTNILCIYKGRDKKVLQENNTKRQARRACVRHQVEGACMSGGTWA